jgi:hypothetical protein
MWDAGIFNEEVMKEIKNAMPRHGDGYKPEIFLETDYGECRESTGDGNFNSERSPGSAHHGKEHVIGSDDDENRGIKGSRQVKTDHGGEHYY